MKLRLGLVVFPPINACRTRLNLFCQPFLCPVKPFTLATQTLSNTELIECAHDVGSPHDANVILPCKAQWSKACKSHPFIRPAEISTCIPGRRDLCLLHLLILPPE